MASEIRPFKIAVPDAALATLKAKLDAVEFPRRTGFSDDVARGSAQTDLERLVARWRDGFDWRAVEAGLNEIPQFTTAVDVDGFDTLDLHFIHQRSRDKKAIPLLFVHGWPGGFWEVKKLLPLLTATREGEPSFHVVSPSLPNFGFSQEVTKPGFSHKQYAEAMHKLMLRLGYDKYATQGGDWGFLVTRTISTLYPSHVLANHINLIVADPPTLLSSPILRIRALLTPITPAERIGLANSGRMLGSGMGYVALQSTRPNTIGHALADSPLALLAWQHEKLLSWSDTESDPRGHPWVDDDEALTWASLYRFSRAGPAASVRIYYEVFATQTLAQGNRWNGAVPIGMSYFPYDLSSLVRDGRTLGPVVFEAIHDRGGHFAAYEVPELLAADLKKMFSLAPGAFGSTVLQKLK